MHKYDFILLLLLQCRRSFQEFCLFFAKNVTNSMMVSLMQFQFVWNSKINWKQHPEKEQKQSCTANINNKYLKCIHTYISTDTRMHTEHIHSKSSDIAFESAQNNRTYNFYGIFFCSHLISHFHIYFFLYLLLFLLCAIRPIILHNTNSTLHTATRVLACISSF